MAVVYVNSDCVHATRHAYQFEEKSATVSNKIMHIHTSSLCISMTVTLYRNHLFAMVDTASMALLKLLQTLLSLCEYCSRIGNLLRFKWPMTKTLLLTTGRKSGQSANEQSEKRLLFGNLKSA